MSEPNAPLVSVLAGAFLVIASFSPTLAYAQDEEIIVTGKVNRVGLTLGRDARGRTTCSLTRSSGDVAIDSAMCRRASRCVKRGEILRPKLDACLAKQRKALIAAWLRGERS